MLSLPRAESVVENWRVGQCRARSIRACRRQVLAWAYWWNSTEDLPEQITNEQVLIELNTDFSMKGMSAQETVSVVKAWQSEVEGEAKGVLGFHGLLQINHLSCTCTFSIFPSNLNGRRSK
jgi:hypothetical protein